MLPANWVTQIDKTTGRQFYVDVTTSKSYWLPPAPLNLHHKSVAMAITSSFERGTTKLAFEECEKVDDRGFTCGVAGFTTGTGDALMVISDFAMKHPNHKLTSYIPRLTQISNQYNGDNPIGSLTGLDGFDKAWKEAALNAFTRNDFQSSQIKIHDKLYFEFAERYSNSIGINIPISRVFMYDSMIQHGESGVDRILNWAGSPLGFMNGQLPGEIIWLRDHFIPAREREINTNSENIGDDGKVLGNDRISAFRYLISQGNFSLNGTVEWIRKDYWGQDSYRFP